MDDRGFAQILEAWHDHLVILLRDQELSETDEVRFAERFGPPAVPPLAFALTKRQVREPVMQRVREDGPQFDVAVQELWEAPTTLAAIRAYVARTFKRSPQ